MTNVLLVVLDAVRARNSSLYGYERATTPYLKRFGERATVYTQARAPGVMSVQSHTSIFTGLHAAQHRLKDAGQRLQPGHTIWEELADTGYDTVVFSYNSYLTQAPVGLKNAFDTVESGADQTVPFPAAFDPGDLETSGLARYREFLRKIATSGRPIRSLLNGLSHWDYTRSVLPKSLQGYVVVPDRVFTDMFLNWQSDRDDSWAACVNYMGAHSPYLPDPEYNVWAGDPERRIMRSVDDHAWSFVVGSRPWSERAKLENLYDGCIRQVDAELERLLTTLDERGVLDETFVVITSDHGEGFGEKGVVRPVRSVAHGNSGGPEEWILHVPLVVRRPGQTEPSRIDHAASLTMFPDAVRAVLGGSVSSEPEPLFVPDDGKALASTFELSSGDRERAPDYVEDFSGYEPRSRIVYRTTADGRIHKHVEWDGNQMVFDCTDIQETVALDDAERGVVAEAFDSLEPVDILEGKTEELTDDVRDRLSRLGYR